jgi:hypothetical protein
MQSIPGVTCIAAFPIGSVEAGRDGPIGELSHVLVR